MHVGKPAERQQRVVVVLDGVRLRRVVPMRGTEHTGWKMLDDGDVVLDVHQHDDDAAAMPWIVHVVLAAKQSAVEAVSTRVLDGAGLQLSATERARQR